MIPASVPRAQRQSDENEIGGAILAGGSASRLDGVAKGLLEARPGVCIIQWQISQLQRANLNDIIIVANDADTYSRFQVPVIPDLREGIGPLGGIEAAVDYCGSRTDATLFVPCDLPAITNTEIEALVDQYRVGAADVVMAEVEGCFLHPLCVVVHNELRYRIADAISDGERRARSLWRRANVQRVTFKDPQPFFNINTPEDLARWQREMEES